MPELPEVETTRCGIEPHLLGKTIQDIVIRHPRLRWPVPQKLKKCLPGERIEAVERRAKYLFLRLARGTIIIHLGMSGSLRILPANTQPGVHDHIDLVLGKQCLRFRDPRRFGAWLWTTTDPYKHKLIQHLGPEPLSSEFNGHYLYDMSRSRKIAIKNFIMDSKVVVGVGNIYASESLFRAGIHPATQCGRIAKTRYLRLVEEIKKVLQEAIAQGGTTLRDFQREDGKAGYFAQKLQVYGRENQSCFRCNHQIRKKIIGQRSSFYCPYCQH